MWKTIKALIRLLDWLVAGGLLLTFSKSARNSTRNAVMKSSRAASKTERSTQQGEAERRQLNEQEHYLS